MSRTIPTWRIMGKPEVIPADPIRAITSGWPTTRPESRTRFARCRSAVYIQQSRARLTLPDLATENREFTWVDTPDLKYSRGAKISDIPRRVDQFQQSIRKRTE